MLQVTELFGHTMKTSAVDGTVSNHIASPLTKNGVFEKKIGYGQSYIENNIFMVLNKSMLDLILTVTWNVGLGKI